MRDGLILLVEDNLDDAELTLRALRQNHIANQVFVAHDGAEALDYLLGADRKTAGGELPEVVLLDLKLPRVDGFEVLRQIRSHSRTRLLPVVVMTSSKEERDVVESYTLGANSYVCKPVTFPELLGAVRQLGLYWLLLNEPPPHA